jgi:uncharacterized protein (TIGR02231 family)
MITTLFLALAADPTSIASSIKDVTLYGSSALVHRAATVPASGSYVVSGLPQVLDADNVRVRCSNGDVISVEVRDRLQESVPNERLQALRDKLKGLTRELQAAQDDVANLKSMESHLQSLLKQDESAHKVDAANGHADPATWTQNYDFLAKKLSENAAARREAGWKLDERVQACQEVERELGRLSAGGGVAVRDVIVEVATRGEAQLDVEYLVHRTGWAPAYDLRTSSDLTQVELGYRAKIWQQTGEDWKDVDIALSTAQPQRGAQGPEPVPTWISLYEAHGDGKPAAAGLAAPREEARKRLGSLGYDGDKDVKYKGKAADDEAPPPFAAVESQGLSVRFKLAKKETVESRVQPTTVLVGRAQLAVTAERSCTPALDTTVWLRGKAKNTSEWTLLPGQAAVFLGADYLGLAQLDTVQPNQEFTLHLGADPSLTVTRTQTEDVSKGPGFLGSRASKVEGWRVKLENHGAQTSAKDGAVDVIVREVLPRSRDERVEVELTKSEPKISKDERWKQDLEEKGIQTWVVHVAKNGSTDIVWQATITYPKGAELVRD